MIGKYPKELHAYHMTNERTHDDDASTGLHRVYNNKKLS